jgi:hypothetical protein
MNRFIGCSKTLYSPFHSSTILTQFTLHCSLCLFVCMSKLFYSIFCIYSLKLHSRSDRSAIGFPTYLHSHLITPCSYLLDHCHVHSILSYFQTKSMCVFCQHTKFFWSCKQPAISNTLWVKIKLGKPVPLDIICDLAEPALWQTRQDQMK